MGIGYFLQGGKIVVRVHRFGYSTIVDGMQATQRCECISRWKLTVGVRPCSNIEMIGHRAKQTSYEHKNLGIGPPLN